MMTILVQKQLSISKNEAMFRQHHQPLLSQVLEGRW